MASYTITFDDSSNGWTSFHSFIPEWMQKLNNRLFSVKGGQLYLHNDEKSDLRNNFYGFQYPTKVTYVANQFPSSIKVAKTIKLEANKPFEVVIRSYISDEKKSITESTIASNEFLNKEGLLFAYIRQNELTDDYTARNAYGVGTVKSSSGNVITFYKPFSKSSISIGDVLLGDDNVPLGNVIDYTDTTIELNNVFPPLASNSFIIGLKDARVEGSEIRGYNFEVELTDNTTDRTELFASNIGAIGSFPS